MRATVAVFSVLIIACACAAPDERLDDGHIHLYYNGYNIDQAKVEAIFDLLRSRLEFYDDVVYRGISVQFANVTPSGTSGLCVHHRASGKFTLFIRVGKDGTFDANIVIHEMLHVYRIVLYNDYSHQPDWFWWPSFHPGALEKEWADEIDSMFSEGQTKEES